MHREDVGMGRYRTERMYYSADECRCTSIDERNMATTELATLADPI
jgi:hypothetical protein